MKAKVSLHTHDNRVSYDTFAPIGPRVKLYKQLDFDALGIVGHDKISDFESNNIVIFNGIERTVSEDPEIHVVELPEFDFKFLAHPRRIDDENTKETARQIIQDRNLDGVEKFNDGEQQYSGSMNTIELANDDAHNFFQTGTSYMEVETNDMNKGQIVQAIQRGDVKLKNKGDRIIGDISKTITASIGKLTRSL